VSAERRTTADALEGDIKYAPRLDAAMRRMLPRHKRMFYGRSCLEEEQLSS